MEADKAATKDSMDVYHVCHVHSSHFQVTRFRLTASKYSVREDDCWNMPFCKRGLP